jgi:hypothetical protein
MLPALSIAIPLGFKPVVAQLAMDTGSKGTVTAGVVVFGAEVAGAVGGVVAAGVVAAGVEAVGSGVWSMTVGSARTLLSATTGCAGVATSVDSSVGNKMGSTGSETDVASRTFGGSGAVARHCFLPLARPHTQTTAFFLRTFPGVEHATDFPLAEMVAYQILLAGVFAHTTDTLETFVTLPALVQAVPATIVALRVFEVSLLPHAAVVATNAITTMLVFHKRLT